MKTLLWKEYRQNRAILIVGVIVFLMPYVVMAGFKVAYPLIYTEQVDFHFIHPWYRILSMACGTSAFTWLLTIALLAGYSMAGERSDRSAEFLAGLPIPQRSALKSKAYFTLLVCLVILVINIGMWQLSASMAPHAGSLPPYPWRTVIAMGIIIYGVAWMCSSFLSSPTIAVGVSIAAPLIVGGLLWWYAWLLDPQFESTHSVPYYTWYDTSAIVVGLAAFCVGSVYYLRRVEA